MTTFIKPSIPNTLESSFPFGAEFILYAKASNNWRINFLNSVNDIALHMDFRFNEKAIVFNSNENNNWKDEQRITIPMEHNDKFLLRLVIQNDSYYIQLVDYDTIYNYSHQLSSSEITSL